MECGVDDNLCQLVSLLKDNEIIATVLTRTLGEVGERAAGFGGLVAGVLKEHGDKLIAAAVFVFGLWKWWRYRERILHKRLKEYLQESDRLLAHGLTDVLTALQRPGPSKPPKLPLFASTQLRSVLRERHWHNAPVAAAVASSAQWQLSSAIEKIERKLKSGEDMMSSLRKELATAHIMKGAIASSGTQRSVTGVNEPKLLALNAFRSALQVPGHEQSEIAKELEAHQLRQLGHFSQALAAYREVEALAPRFDDYRTQRLVIARAKRYQAEMQQVLASRMAASDNRVFDSSLGAYRLIGENSPGSALQIRANFAPYQGWDLLEQGDLHYLTAFIAHNANFPGVREVQLNQAETAYRSVLTAPIHRFRSSKGLSRLRARAKIGDDLVQRAKSKQEFWWQWMMPD